MSEFIAPTTSGLVDWDELWSTPAQPEWLLEPFLARGRSHALYAPAKAGKSLLALYAAAALATGRPAFDGSPLDPKTVLYVDAEMTADDLVERMESFGYGRGDALDNLKYFLLPDLPPLDTADGGGELLELARWHGADLVVFDTVARTTAGEENSSDTGRNLARFTTQPLKANGITSLRLDHSGKDPSKGQRGTSAKSDDVDVVISLAPADEGVRLTATHRRIGWYPERTDLRMVEDPLRYTQATTWPAGTKACAELLDELGVPLNASRRTAASALREAGHSARNETVSAALKWRRNHRDHLGDQGNSQVGDQ